MMDWTDRYDRYFLRLISRRALLYTEMVTALAVVRGDRQRLIGFDAAEHPLALQLGGSDPVLLAEAARIGEGFGYDEINLNVGCPSDRVQSGRFGACLMAEPKLVADCIAAMGSAVRIPVTAKCRIGIDDQDEEEALNGFVDTVAAAGCGSFIVHARKAWLDGLSPKQNRDVPPLNYDLVYALKRRRPDLDVSINGGIGDLDEAAAHLAQCDGVMLGRAAYQSPYILADVDRRFFSDQDPVPTRAGIVMELMPYVERRLAQGVRLNQITRHILGLYQQVPGARLWRRHLSENAHKPGAEASVITDAFALVSAAQQKVLETA
jgi:tRNA-dihydrouridine synthase A